MTAPTAPPQARARRGAGAGRAAVLIGALTVLARAVGFGRQLVFAHTVRAGCLGTAYTTANMVPNVIYDIVLGGALSAVVVPVLAPRHAGPGAEAARDRVSGALLTWTVLLLTPVSVLVAVLAGPLAAALLGTPAGCPRAPVVAVSAGMLRVFAPQILLYGLAVVLYGILQSHRRFAAPALAPVLSSLVVTGTYAWFGAAYGRAAVTARGLPAAGWLLLAAGTTAGVAALVVTPLVPAARLGLRWRPALRFPGDVAARVRSLAGAGVATLLAQDAAVVVVMVLANARGGAGALVLYSYAWAIFLLPYAVLAVPVATSAFPSLSEAAALSPPRFAAVTATSARAVIVASGLGVAALAGTCLPLARVFDRGAGGPLAVTLALFAPGLIGYGVIATLSRALYAAGRSRAAAAAVCGGWLTVIACDAAVVPFVPRSWVVPVLGGATSAGLSLGGFVLIMLVRSMPGGPLHGCGRALAAAAAGAVAGAAAGWAVSLALPAGGLAVSAGQTALAGLVAAGLFLTAAALLDGGDLRAVLRRLVPRRLEQR